MASRSCNLFFFLNWHSNAPQLQTFTDQRHVCFYNMWDKEEREKKSSRQKPVMKKIKYLTNALMDFIRAWITIICRAESEQGLGQRKKAGQEVKNGLCLPGQPQSWIPQQGFWREDLAWHALHLPSEKITPCGPWKNAFPSLALTTWKLDHKHRTLMTQITRAIAQKSVCPDAKNANLARTINKPARLDLPYVSI